MPLLKDICLKAIPVLLLIAVLWAVTAYDKKPYDYTSDESDDTAYTSEDTAEEDTTVALEDTTADTTEDTTAEILPPPADETDEINEFFATLDSTEVLLSVGYGISDKEYGDGLRLSLLSRSIGGDTESLRSTANLVPVRIPDEVYDTYSTVLQEAESELPLISIYMDFLFVDNGETFKVYDKGGKLIFERFDTEEFVPLYSRDKAGHPLFAREEKVADNTVTKYYYLDEIGALIESDYDDKADNRGLYINYPSYYGVSENHLHVEYSPIHELYGYAEWDGTMGSGYSYKNAYNFSEGLAAIVDIEGVLNYTDRGIYRTIYSNGWYYNENNERVRPLLVEPDTRGIESLGFFYFEDGLCRVRRQTVNAYLWETYRQKRIVTDEDIIIRTDGSEFETPEGYEVVAYSSGMILLEKDGLFGYMKHTGEWVLEPLYTYALPFSEGLAVVGAEGKVGLIDTEGIFLVPMIFDHIGSPSGGLITLYDEKHGWTIMNKCIYPT